jgi:histidine kinase
MSAAKTGTAVPHRNTSVTLRGAPIPVVATMAAARSTLLTMTRFCVLVYLFAALLLDASYQLHLSLGGARFQSIELLSTFVFFSVWLPFMPLVVRLAQRFAPTPGRRMRAFDVHFFAALALSCATLFAHKLVFCPRGCYWNCLTHYGPEAWVARWFALDAFLYAGVVTAIWLAAVLERTRSSERKAAAVERELASAELRLMRSQINPSKLIDTFGSISARVGVDPVQAERMLTLLADFLRLNLRALGANDLTIGDDIDLLRAWLAIERERTGRDVQLRLDLDSSIAALPIITPLLQPIVAASLPPAAGSVHIVADTDRAIIVIADGVEIGRAAA